MLKVLEDIRTHFNNKVKIISGYRCVLHNIVVGGAAKSKHMIGIAADISVDNHTPREVYEYLNALYPDTYGIGLYSTWVHIDVRPDKARW